MPDRPVTAGAVPSPISAPSAGSTAATCSATPYSRAERPSGSPYQAPTQSRGKSAPPPPCRPFRGSRACSAERCAVAKHWPDCGQFVSLSDGRASAPKNDLPCGLVTFVCPGLPQEDVPVGTEPVFYGSKSRPVKYI